MSDPIARMEGEIRGRLDRIASSGSYSADDFSFFKNLFPKGMEETRSEIREILNVPSADDVIFN
jgi:hypothetical protein